MHNAIIITTVTITTTVTFTRTFMRTHSLYLFIYIYSKLDKSILGLQIPTYICLSLLSIIICVLIGGVALFDINGMLEVVIVLAIVCFGLLLASIIIAARKKDIPTTTSEEMITITKAEYENLKRENEELKKQIESLKQQ